MRRTSPAVFIFALVALCAFLVAWQRASQRRGGISVPESGVLLALRPAQKVLNGTGVWASDIGSAMFRRRGLVRENEELRGEVDNLRGQNQRLLSYQRENQRLNALLKMPKLAGGKSLACEVVGLSATDVSHAVTLNIGARSGVRVKDVVYNAQGVVGQVTDVSPFSCRALLLTDRVSGIGAMIERTQAKGIVKGNGGRLCTLSYLDFGADVREGDLVVSSGVSQIFPRGMPIGQVVEVKRDKHYSQLTATVDPTVAFDRLSAVYVRVGAG